MTATVNFGKNETRYATKGNVALASEGVIVFPNVTLKKDGTPKKLNTKKEKGTKSEVYSLEIEDMKKIISYFEDNNKWLPYLIFVLSCNMARRIGDTMSLTWEHFFNPKTGLMRTYVLGFKEEKTDKLANPRINSACKAAIEKYIEKTGCVPSDNGYKTNVCRQLSGTHKGSDMSTSGYYKALKKAATEVGITYNVGTHSPRKTFGRFNRMIHPADPDSKELLKMIYNHADTKVTERYIGITKEKIDEYYDDFGRFFDDYITGDKEYVSSSPIISLDSNDLYDLLKMAYEEGMKNANAYPMAHVEAIATIMGLVPELSK